MSEATALRFPHTNTLTVCQGITTQAQVTYEVWNEKGRGKKKKNNTGNIMLK